ncbi:MAG: hypothetical protein AAF798_13605 [Bacteroidota bacterium]
MKNLTFQPYYFFFLFAFFLAACSSPQDLLEQGDYDRAVYLAIDKLAGKKKRAKHVQALEEAFAKATQRNLYQIERLKMENQAANWERIYDLYVTMRKRQDAVRPLLPLVDQDGVQASFKFVRTDQLELDARRKAADFHYVDAQNLLRQAESGDRQAARAAYIKLEKVERLERNYKNIRTLEQLALNLGNTRIFLHLQNDAPTILPASFERELLSFSLQDLNSNWQTFSTRNDPEQPPHYEVVVRFTNIAVSPESIREREFEESREIEDGFNYVLDEKGNVMKDTLGNDIKVPNTVLVRAQILESLQQKSANLSGVVEIMDKVNGSLLHREPISVNTVFENYASTFRGDKRALTQETKRYIGNQPVPFPTDADMLLLAADELKPIVRNFLRNNRKMI